MMRFLSRFFSRVRISYGITVCNEAAELDRLLAVLTAERHKHDEIIVLQDVTNRSIEVSKVISKYQEKIIVKESLLQGDFATFKNSLIDLAAGNFLFQIDADEVPQLALLRQLKSILRRKYKYDCFLVPRINIVNGISADHIKEWNWNLDEENRVNFPDYQSRIFRLNGKISWKNKVHEELSGWERQYYFPIKNDDFCLLHVKGIEKQITQNEFYKHLS